jgi:hypothetical protein
MPRRTARREALVLTQAVVGPSCVLLALCHRRSCWPSSACNAVLKRRYSRQTSTDRGKPENDSRPLRDKLFRLYRLRLNAHGPQSRERERHG